jgi:hypothetical protein
MQALTGMPDHGVDKDVFYGLLRQAGEQAGTQ